MSDQPTATPDAEERLAAVLALAEEATQRAYMEIATAQMLTIMPHPDDSGRAYVPPHWRDQAEAAASVSVADLRAAAGGAS